MIRNQGRNCGLIVAIGVLTLAGVAYAQSSTMRMDIPFQFNAGGQLLPADQYTVSIDTAFGFISIRSTASNAGTYLLAGIRRHVPVLERGQLQFHRYEDSYFLRQVGFDGHAARELPATRAERTLARAHTLIHVALLRSDTR